MGDVAETRGGLVVRGDIKGEGEDKIVVAEMQREVDYLVDSKQGDL